MWFILYLGSKMIVMGLILKFNLSEVIFYRYVQLDLNIFVVEVYKVRELKRDVFLVFCDVDVWLVIFFL